jgi:hypothetical protein
MSDVGSLATDALNAAASARSSESEREDAPTISRTAAGLSRSISALQRCYEILEKQHANAVKRGERRDAEAIGIQMTKVKEQKAFYQSFYEREIGL